MRVISGTDRPKYAGQPILQEEFSVEAQDRRGGSPGRVVHPLTHSTAAAEDLQRSIEGHPDKTSQMQNEIPGDAQAGPVFRLRVHWNAKGGLVQGAYLRIETTLHMRS